LSHPFVICVYEILEDAHRTYLVLEWGGKGDLAHQGKVTEHRAREIFIQLVNAIRYLHDTENVVHGDIKLENVVIDELGYTKLIDFGLAQIPGTENCRRGTRRYLAPELIRGQSNTKSSDIWCLGIVLYALITGHFPFSGSDSRLMKQDIVSSEPQFPADLSYSLVSLMKGILHKDPQKRTTLAEISEDVWVRRDRSLKDVFDTFGVQSWRFDATAAAKITERKKQMQTLSERVDNRRMKIHSTLSVLGRENIPPLLNLPVQGGGQMKRMTSLVFSWGP
jgi:serine/threonine protein kinase